MADDSLQVLLDELYRLHGELQALALAGDWRAFAEQLGRRDQQLNLLEPLLHNAVAGGSLLPEQARELVDGLLAQNRALAGRAENHKGSVGAEGLRQARTNKALGAYQGNAKSKGVSDR